MILRKGDRGEAVRQVQEALRNLGFDIVVDGVFGEQTRAAVMGFQRKRSLQVDGKVGSETLRALGLELLPDGSLGASNGTPNSRDFDFDFEPEVVIPSAEEALVEPHIRKYVELLKEKHRRLLEVSDRALQQFETTMAFASASEADPDVLGSLLSTTLDFAAGEFISRLGESLGESSTALAFAKAAFGETSAEIRRAEHASASLTVGNWIKDQRELIDNASRRFDQLDLGEEMIQQFRDAPDRDRFEHDLFNSIEQLQEEVLPPVEVLEYRLYEQWINAHFRTIGDDGPGCIEFRYEFEDNEFNFVSCTVETPFGDKVETALNRLLDKGLLGVRRPIELKVRKRGCFFVDGLGIGKVWSCGWLDQDNQLMSRPIHDDAQEAIAHLPRLSTPRFRR